MNRVDGKRLLKSNALPTFQTTNAKKPRTRSKSLLRKKLRNPRLQPQKEIVEPAAHKEHAYARPQDEAPEGQDMDLQHTEG